MLAQIGLNDMILKKPNKQKPLKKSPGKKYFVSCLVNSMQVDRKKPKNPDKTNNATLDLIQRCWPTSLAVQEKAAIENLIPCNTTKGDKESIL